jgi:uncharacterized membrane-anchored protein YhcB (DUF1043 family)
MPGFQEDQGSFIVKPQLDSNETDDFELDKLSLKEKDELFMQLQQLADAKKRMLLENQRKIMKESSKNNEFLDRVKEDYAKYNQYFVKQGNDLVRALEIIREHIQDLNSSGELSEQNVKDSKEEQKKIAKEIEEIQHFLRELS